VTLTALAAFALIAFSPGLTRIPVLDRDEARYAQATRQMLETGDYVDIRFQSEPRHVQPIGIYWLQAAAVHLSGAAPHAPIWVHRLPSLAGAVAAVLLTYRAALALGGPATALVAALLLAASTLLGWEARLAKTDAVLLAATTGAAGLLARAYLAQPVTRPMLFWVALAAGVLVKGPIILLVLGSAIAALAWLDGSWAWFRALRPGRGTVMFLLLILPWLVAIGITSGGSFFTAALGGNLLGKAFSGHEGHGALPGTHLALLPLAFWPTGLLAFSAARWTWRQRHDRSVRFCLAWIVPAWIVFELAANKLPHYPLPVYPAVAILVARWLVAGARPGMVASVALFVIGSLPPAVGVVFLSVMEEHASMTALALSALGLVVLAWTLRRRAGPVAFAAGLALAAILIHLASFGVVLPRLRVGGLTPALAESVARVRACPRPQIVSSGYHEPSLVFTLGTDVGLVYPTQAAQFIGAGGCRIALVERSQEATFQSILAITGGRAVLRERVSRLNLARLSIDEVAVYAPPDR
jgi:4-amino-4-deoxy-L-arabinose transferase-like glycosyltransferase